MNRILLLLVTAGLAFGQDWPVYGGDAGGARHSPLKVINRSNVAKLKTAWIFPTGDVSDGTEYPVLSAFEAMPPAKGRGGANMWSIPTVVTQRGIVFLPRTSPSADYYGGDRKGAGLFGDSLVAVEALTGKPIWHS